MNAPSDPALVSFAAELIERQGGVVEYRGSELFSLLPEKLARSLELPEEATIGGDETPLLYGSPLVDRIIRVATGDVPVVYARVLVPYLKKDGFERVIAQDLELAGASVSIAGRAETVASYMVMVCHYVALSDERKEGLVQVAVAEYSSAHVSGLEELLHNFQIDLYPQGQIPPQFTVSLDKALAQALRVARETTNAELAPFVDGMRRRLHRDVRSTREYYEAFKQEMEETLDRQGLTDVLLEERRSKIADLPREMDLKIRDLQQKYSVKVTITGRAALRLLVPVVQIMVNIRYRKLNRSLSLTWNPVTQGLDPLVCEDCGKTVRLVFPYEEKSSFLLVCKSCRDRT
jgi:hypothetical protein